MDDVVKAASKHREAVSLKELCEKQKKKIKEYIEEIDKKDCQFDESEERIKQLEEDVEIGYGMNARKRKTIEKLNKEVEDHKKKVHEMKDILMKLEKKKEISEKVITNLQEELELKQSNLYAIEHKLKEKEIFVKVTAKKTESEVLQLISEINVLQGENSSKKDLLDNISIENEDLKEKLKLKEREIEEMKETEKISYSEVREETSLSIELGLADSNTLNSNLECHPFNTRSETKAKNKNHVMKQHEVRIKNLESKIHTQQLQLSASLFILKEKEVIEKNQCNCRSYCRIFHIKHNWTKSKCSEILMKFQRF